MMERYSGDFLAAVDGLRALLGCRGRVWPISVEQRVCAPSTATASRDARRSRGRRRAGAGRQVRRVWLEPPVAIHPAVADAIRWFDAVIIGPGSFFTSLMPPLLVRGVREALAAVRGPVILIANLLTEGRGMAGFTAADAVRWVSRGDRPSGRRGDLQHGRPSAEVADAVRRRTQGAAGARRLDPARASRCSGAFWCTRDRAPRSAAPGVCRLGRAVSERLLQDDQRITEFSEAQEVYRSSSAALLFFGLRLRALSPLRAAGLRARRPDPEPGPR